MLNAPSRNLNTLFKCFLITLLPLITTGCGYFKNIGYDASEIVQVQVGSGKGAAIDVYASFLFGEGQGYYKMKWKGYGPCYVSHCRCHYGTITQKYFQILIVTQCEDVDPKSGDLLLPSWVSWDILRGTFRGEYSKIGSETLSHQQVIDKKQLLREQLWRVMDVGFTLVPINYGIRMDISPGKALDFFCSIFCLDPEDDNIYQNNGKVKEEYLDKVGTDK